MADAMTPCLNLGLTSPDIGMLQLYRLCSTTNPDAVHIMTEKVRELIILPRHFKAKPRDRRYFNLKPMNGLDALLAPVHKSLDKEADE